MATRQEVLKHRARWITALQMTITLYQECIKKKSVDPFLEQRCAFCLLIEDIKPYIFSDGCKLCIHNSPYVKTTHCMDIDDFDTIYYAFVYSDEIEKLMKERITYHKNIIRKLKRAKV